MEETKLCPYCGKEIKRNAKSAAFATSGLPNNLKRVPRRLNVSQQHPRR